MKLLTVLRQIRELGFDPAAFFKYLVAHMDEINTIINALLALLASRGFAASADCTDDEAVSECVAMGCDPGDCKIVMAELAE